MKKIFFAFLLVIPLISLSQEWSSPHYVAHYRNIMDVQAIDMHKISVLGGNAYNDSITFFSFSDDSGENWVFDDIFPGKLIMSGLYYNSGEAICGGDNELCYRSLNFGETWEASSFNIDLNHRDINSFHKGDLGVAYACGGLDAENGFIIKSVNSGDNWAISCEFPNNEVFSISENSNNKLFVSGLNNFLKYSENGVDNWQDATIESYSETCDFNKLAFWGDEIGYCVGGKHGADSIQLILKTIDSGETWTSCFQEINPCLNDICIINDSTAYVVGDYGIVLKTINTGESWEEVIIPENPEVNFHSVSFINNHYGVIAGAYGIVFVYNDGITSAPEATTLEASDVTNNSVKLNATINANFLPSTVTFKFGLDEPLSNTILLGEFDGGNIENISYSLTGLEEDSHYYFCVQIENDQFGIAQGDIKLIYTGNPIPNWDFELWTEETFNFLDNWIAEGFFEKIQEGNDFAIKLLPCGYSNEQDDFSSVMNAEINGDNITPWNIPAECISGGAEISIRPDSVYVNIKYNVNEQDSAILFVALLKNNEYVSKTFYIITGNEEEFTQHGYKIDYLNNNIPDRAVIVVSNSNPFDTDTIYNSELAISEIHFSPSVDIQNNEFSDWSSNVINYPLSWKYPDYNDYHTGIDDSPCFLKSDDAYLHEYAIILQNIVTDTDSIVGEISLADYNEGIPIDKRYESLSAFYKYFPENNDTAQIQLVMYKAGQSIGWGAFEQDETVSIWTKLKVEIMYSYEDIVPDSMNIFINASQWPLTGESEFHLDKISIDGDFIPVNVFSSIEVDIYPNPANAYICFSEPLENIQVFSIQGMLIKEYTGTTNKINVKELPTGIYFLRYELNNKLGQSKFVKQ